MMSDDGLRFENIDWILAENQPLSRLLEEEHGTDMEYLETIDTLVRNLRNRKCENLREKAAEVGQLKDFYAFMSELRFAEYFSSYGASTALVLDDKSGNKSPDLRLEFGGQSYLVEVTRLTEDTITTTVIELFRRLFEVMPYLKAIVTAELKCDLSTPKMGREERRVQNLLVLRSVGEFLVRLCKHPFALPDEIETEGIVFHLEPSRTLKSYVVVSGSVIAVPTKDINDRIAEDLLVKAGKRASFGFDSMSPRYMIAYDCEEPLVDTTDLEELLYGSGETFVGANGKYSDLVHRKWEEAVASVERTAEWRRVQLSSLNGWTELLKKHHLIPNDFTYVPRPGLFISDSNMDGVTSIILRTASGVIEFFPNPFCALDVNLLGRIPEFMNPTNRLHGRGTEWDVNAP